MIGLIVGTVITVINGGYIMMHVSRDFERKTVTFIVGLVVVMTLFGVWLARTVANDGEE
jgi:uncharacterized membrane protein